MTLPVVLHAWPSGQIPALVSVAASPRARVVLPVPAAPARMVSLPVASQVGQSQLIGCGVMVAACTMFASQDAPREASIAIVAASSAVTGIRTPPAHD